MLELWLKGLLLGLSIAMPLDPIGVLCIRRSLSGGFGSGFCTGIGTATADAVYAIMAAIGFSALSSLLLSLQGWLQGIGGLFLLYLARETFRSQPPRPTLSSESLPHFRAAISSFGLTLTNPLTILSFAALLAGVGVGGNGELASSLSFVCGIFFGSLLWWIFLSAAASRARNLLTPTSLKIVQYAAALIIGAFGIAALWSCLRQIA